MYTEKKEEIKISSSYLLVVSFLFIVCIVLATPIYLLTIHRPCIYTQSYRKYFSTREITMSRALFLSISKVPIFDITFICMTNARSSSSQSATFVLFPFSFIYFLIFWTQKEEKKIMHSFYLFIVSSNGIENFENSFLPSDFLDVLGR